MKLNETALERTGLIMMDSIVIPPETEEEALREVYIPYAISNKHMCACGRPECKGAVVYYDTFCLS